MSNTPSSNSPPKGEISKLIKSYSKTGDALSYINDGTKLAHVSTTIENCHPTLNGYREHVTFSDSEGHAFAKKIIVKCLRCTEVNKKLYPDT